MSGPLDIARAALDGQDAWLVGGTIRDRLLNRGGPDGPLDNDIVLPGDVAAAAEAVRRAAAGGSAAFALSDDFGAWRVVGPAHAWQIDLSPLLDGSLDADLRRRDLTLNALAEPLSGGELLDPTGGLADLRAGTLRMVSPWSFSDDPLRVMRLARLAVDLGFRIDLVTADAARAAAPGLDACAGERVFGELRQVVAADDALQGIRLLEDLGAAAAVLPELLALRGVEQTVYHHLDAHDHTLEVLERAIELQRAPQAILGPQLGARVQALLQQPLSDELTRGGALRLGALLHDIAKPQTQVQLDGGRVGFPHHDREGAELSRSMLSRLRTSERLRAHVAALARHHLRLGFLVHEAPLDRRAVHRYLVACDPVAADVTLLSIADRLATRGRKADVAIAAHLDVGLPVLGAALDAQAAGPAQPLVRGDVLAAALGIEPGPRIGDLLADIAEAQYAGEVTDEAGAIALARTLS